MNDLQKKLFLEDGMEESELNIKKYIQGFLRHKWLFLFVAIIIFLGWQFYFVKNIFKKSYALTTVVSFESPKTLTKSINPVADVTTMESQGKVAVLRSFDFLKDIVLELNLTLKMTGDNLTRQDVFYQIDLNENALPGYYQLKYEGKTFRLFFDKDGKYGTLPMTSADIFQKDDSLFLDIANSRLVLKESVVRQEGGMEFKILSLPRAVKRLRDSIRPQVIARSGIININFKGSDPQLLVKEANIITERFVKKSVGFSKRRTREVVKVLEDQLNITREKLERAELALRAFKEKSSTVIIGQAGLRMINNLTTLAKSEETIKGHLSDLNQYEERRKKAQTLEDKILVDKEIIPFLGSWGDPAATDLQNEYNNLMSERDRLVNDLRYSQDHPQVKANLEAIETLSEKIYQDAQNFKNNLEKESFQSKRAMAKISRDLRSLPNKQYQLAKLQRERDVNDQIYKSVLLRYNEAKLADAVEIGSASILQRAFFPDETSLNLNPIFRIILGVVISVVGGIFLVLGINLFDKKIHGHSDLKKYIKLPLLTSIPQIGNSRLLPKEVSLEDKKKIDPKLVTTDYSPTPVGEAYRALRTNLMYSKEFEKISTLVITSTLAGEGKSLTAANLAVTFAQQKLPTLLIDCDLRRGVLHSSFVCQKKPGFSDLLSSRAPITLANMTKVIQKTHVPNLYIISSGSFFPNPQELLGSLKMKKTLEVLKEKFSVLILDTPPLNATADALIVSSYADGVIYVIREGVTNGELARNKISLFDTVGGKMLGVVLNGVQDKDKLKSHYNYSYYNY